MKESFDTVTCDICAKDFVWKKLRETKEYDFRIAIHYSKSINCYDSAKVVLYMHSELAKSYLLKDIAVAAHELGHYEQALYGYWLMKIREKSGVFIRRILDVFIEADANRRGMLILGDYAKGYEQDIAKMYQKMLWAYKKEAIRF